MSKSSEEASSLVTGGSTFVNDEGYEENLDHGDMDLNDVVSDPGGAISVHAGVA